ncbi:MAG: hypothetical protein QNJ63_06350 [Calothrix sp. MO_192.B10]|nr:hypothetical protein [Calothrix sp. MO_192.B10]
MYFYNAYGLVIQSVIPLPELVTSVEKNADLVIQRGEIERSQAETDMGIYRFHVSGEEVYFAWDQKVTFLVRNGKEIIFETFPGMEEELIRFPILGMLLAVLLHQRGFLVMHASTVEINGAAVSFLGKKGMGKSTMAATLYSRGHRLIADDVIAIDIKNTTNTPIVFPGFPQFKLWPEAAVAALGKDPDKLPRLVYGYEKRTCSASDNFVLEPLPLKCLYILTEGSIPKIQPVESQQKIVNLIANSHIARIANPLVQGVGGITLFKQFTNLMNSVPINYLERPRSLALLTEVARLLEEDLACHI